MTNQTQDHRLPTLVLGGTGKTGRRIVDRLQRRGVPVRVGSRAAQPAFDWEDRSTWAPALTGVEAVYISYYPDIAVDGSAETVSALAELAVAHGTRRIVLLSGRGEAEAERAEQAVRSIFPATTVLRASWFNQNFSENFFVDGILAGELALPVDQVREPFIDAEDIADAAVAALTGEAHAGRLYELTGPRLMTFADAVAEIATAAGREISFVPVRPADYAVDLAEQQVPENYASLVMYLFAEVLDGRNESLTDGVHEALGRPPRDFRDYAREAAATGVWAVSDEFVGSLR